MFFGCTQQFYGGKVTSFTFFSWHIKQTDQKALSLHLTAIVWANSFSAPFCSSITLNITVHAAFFLSHPYSHHYHPYHHQHYRHIVQCPLECPDNLVCYSDGRPPPSVEPIGFTNTKKCVLSFNQVSHSKASVVENLKHAFLNTEFIFWRNVHTTILD